MSNRPDHFEIPSDNPEQAMAFFEKAFGWKFKQFGDAPYWIVLTGTEENPGINGGIMKKRDPRQPVVNSIHVDNIDTAIKKIEISGGKIVVPKTPIPNFGWSAYFTDLDGNIHGVYQHDDAVK